MSTTDIERIRSGERFTWGHVDKIYDIEEYTIVRFNPRIVDGFTVTHSIDYGKFSYHAWISGKDTCRSYDSLEAAINGAICYKIEGPNGRLANYIQILLEALSKKEPS